MARQLSQKQLLIRSIIKTYRKSIWNSFVASCKNYGLISNEDVVGVYLKNDCASLLLLMLLIHLKNISDTDFSIKCFGQCDLSDVLGLELISCNDKNTAVLLAKESGVTKLAFSDNLNDVINKIIYNLFYNSSVSSVLPKEDIDGITVIRPLFSVYQSDINKWRAFNNISLSLNADENIEMSNLVNRIKRINPDIEHNVFTSVHNVKLDTLIGYNIKGEKHSFLDEY